MRSKQLQMAHFQNSNIQPLPHSLQQPTIEPWLSKKKFCLCCNIAYTCILHSNSPQKSLRKSTGNWQQRPNPPRPSGNVTTLTNLPLFSLALYSEANQQFAHNRKGFAFTSSFSFFVSHIKKQTHHTLSSNSHKSAAKRRRKLNPHKINQAKQLYGTRWYDFFPNSIQNEHVVYWTNLHSVCSYISSSDYKVFLVIFNLSSNQQQHLFYYPNSFMHHSLRFINYCSTVIPLFTAFYTQTVWRVIHRESCIDV